MPSNYNEIGSAVIEHSGDDDGEPKTISNENNKNQINQVPLTLPKPPVIITEKQRAKAAAEEYSDDEFEASIDLSSIKKSQPEPIQSGSNNKINLSTNSYQPQKPAGFSPSINNVRQDLKPLAPSTLPPVNNASTKPSYSPTPPPFDNPTSGSRKSSGARVLNARYYPGVNNGPNLPSTLPLPTVSGLPAINSNAGIPGVKRYGSNGMDNDTLRGFSNLNVKNDVGVAPPVYSNFDKANDFPVYSGTKFEKFSNSDKVGSMGSDSKFNSDKGSFSSNQNDKYNNRGNMLPVVKSVLNNESKYNGGGDILSNLSDNKYTSAFAEKNPNYQSGNKYASAINAASQFSANIPPPAINVPRKPTFTSNNLPPNSNSYSNSNNSNYSNNSNAFINNSPNYNSINNSNSYSNSYSTNSNLNPISKDYDSLSTLPALNANSRRTVNNSAPSSIPVDRRRNNMAALGASIFDK